MPIYVYKYIQECVLEEMAESERDLIAKKRCACVYVCTYVISGELQQICKHFGLLFAETKPLKCNN